MSDMGAIVVGGIAATVAIWGVYTQRAIHRRRATIELLTRIELDKDFVEARKQVLALAKTNAIASYALEDKKDLEETGKIRLILNLYELVAIGVKRGTLDYWIWRKYFRKGTLTFWNYAAPFIDKLRHDLGNPRIYKEFEWLKDRMNARLPPIGVYFWGQWF